MNVGKDLAQNADTLVAARSARLHAAGGYVFYVIALLTLVNVFNYMDRMALAVLMPAIKADLKLTDGELGLLVGLAFSLFYAICGMPIARLADRGSRKTIIAACLGIWSLMTSLSGAATAFWHLFVARMGVGAAEAGGLPAAQSVICDYIRPERRPIAFAVHNAGLMAGMMLGILAAGLLEGLVGWRWAFVLLGVPGLLFALIVALTLREPARGFFDTDAGDAKPGLLETAKTLFGCRTFNLLISFNILIGFIQYTIQQWLPSFYARTFGASISEIGLWLGLATGIASAVGLLAGGLLATRISRRGVGTPFFIAAIGMIGAMIAASGILLVPDMRLSICMAAATFVLWSLPTGAVVTALHGVTLPAMRATAASLIIFFGSIFGTALGSYCVGLVSDALSPSLGKEALRYALLIPVGMFPLLALVLFGIGRFLQDDLLETPKRSS